MMAMASQSSWHPAFMPNSTADIITKGPSPPSNAPAPHDSIPQIVQPTSIPSPSEPRVQEVPFDTADTYAPEENNDEHSELADLRDALTTSLASPGGVELDENPVNDDIAETDTIYKEKADFPSEGPSPANKHSSTMSFARTVSEEVNWGEDDEVDSEWNIRRTDTDPFKLMAKSDRTNSFPQVPPAHSPATAFEPLHSEVEEIKKEEERVPRDLFSDDDTDGGADFFSQGVHSNNNTQEHSESAHENVQASSFDQAVAQEEDQDSQARYEEGIPLVQPPEDSNAPLNGVSLFMDDGEEEDSFFTQVRQPDALTQEQAPKPPQLERKSTTQVMNSLHFEPHGQTQATVPEDDDISSSQSSLDRATGGGIAVSSSTVISQVLGKSTANLELDSGEGDLAEKWKAALAGDEFLDDDDDFLVDDESSESKPLDPLAVFGSDDEGFLDEEDDQPGSTDFYSKTISPPIPAPVRNSSGQIIGFDRLSGSAQANVTRPGSSSNSRYVPAGTRSVAPVSGNPYAPTAPVFTDLSRRGSSGATGAAPSAYTSSMNSTLPHQVAQSQRPELKKAQSFADKSKGGYSSPYDLPIDVVKPRKPANAQPRSHSYNQPQLHVPVAPPRSSSMIAPQPPPSRGTTSSLSPPTSSHGAQQSQSQNPSDLGSTPPGPPTLKSKASFFEELPMSSRPKAAPRHSSGQGSYTANPPPFAHPPPQAPPQPSQGLVAPERVSPYSSLPSNNMTLPAIASRYSPAPTQSQSQAMPLPPVAQSRYSPAPPSQVRQASYNNQPVASIPPMLPHQPRTSSPLAHFSHDSRSNPSAQLSNFDRRASSSYEPSLKPHSLPPTREVDENEQSEALAEPPAQTYQPTQPNPAQFGMRQSQTPPPVQGFASRMGNSPPRRSTSSNYAPQQGLSRSSASPSFSPPKRSQTQSPGTAYTGPRLESSNVEPYQRPASVETPISPRASISHVSMPVIPTTRPRGFSQGYNYVAPTDGREVDPMQRWRGAPVFVWGVGGSLISSFPQDVPRYGMNQSAPMVLRSPGEVKIRNIKELAPLTERLTSFPGPLKGKSKKKEVVAWLTSGIMMLEQNASYLRTTLSLSHEDKRTEERILLWQILRIFIENDGILEGNAVLDKAVRSLLSPGLDDEVSGSGPLYATGSELSGISHSTTSATRSEPVDPAAVDQLRKHLLRGEREKAVWEAVDKRLWAHAMLISNTVSKDLYKQVAQEFIQKEVKNIGDNTESLAALYEIFAGNFEESVDELVPPSARAGFQMVSTSNSAGPSKDALDGLDRWRETLSLVLSNRSTDDSQALSALGKLLSGYGRAEAAHICFLFARIHSVFGGIDDPQASIVLVGSDHLRQPFEFDRELEPVLLSEVYEYGMSLSSTSNIAISSPHLAIYKIQHALTLAEYGYREKALQYCEAIATSITSQTRRSPYHHSLLVSELDDLSKRLKQSPKDEKSSWISKPSIDKVSGSVWSKFNKFVAGEENDGGTPGSNTEGGSESGPFARIAGGTPTISRSPSASDLYGSYNGGIGINGTLAQSSVAGSRYAPSGSFTPPIDQNNFQPGSYGSQGRSSFEGRISGEHRRGPYDPVRRGSDYRPDSQPAPNAYVSQTPTFTPQTSSYSPYGNHSPHSHSEPGLPFGTPSAGVNNNQSASSIYSSPPPLNTLDGYQPSPYEALRPVFEPRQSSGYEPSSSSGYEPPSNSSYEPPSGGYEPPSYEPTTMNEEPDSPIDTRPKKKSFMDDDYDDDNTPAVKQVPDSHEKSKAEKDREAQEAFRKAAEADAARPKEAAPAKKGWGLGGWFGGAKKEPTDAAASPNKPIRAKLGEESSFVYDPELKRWINKKGGADNTPTPTATPPPPRAAGPPRSVSGAQPPGPTSAPRMGMSSRVSSAISDAPFSGSNAPPASAPPAISGLAAPPAMSRSVSNGSVGPGSGPPSRPGTSMSNASSIDDLLGPALPGGRKGTAKMKKKGRGYIDVMGEKAPGA